MRASGARRHACTDTAVHFSTAAERANAQALADVAMLLPEWIGKALGKSVGKSPSTAEMASR